MNDSMAGFIRVRGTGRDGFPAVGIDCHVDVCQADGTWIPLRGFCGMTINLRADDIVRATMEMELGAIEDLDVAGIDAIRMVASRLVVDD